MAGKKPQQTLSGSERLVLAQLADLQSTGKLLLLHERAWSAEGFDLSRPGVPHQFRPVPQSLLLVELALSTPDAAKTLDQSVTALQQRELLQVVPTPIDGHVDFAYYRQTGDVLLSRTSPLDRLTIINIYHKWPPEPADKPAESYEIPLQDDGQHLGLGYQINDAALRLLNQSQPAPVQQELAEGDRLTVTEVAAKYKVDRDQVYGWINTGLLPAIDVSRQGTRKRRFLISSKALAEFETRRTLNLQPKTRRKPPDADIIEYY